MKCIIRLFYMFIYYIFDVNRLTFYSRHRPFATYGPRVSRDRRRWKQHGVCERGAPPKTLLYLHLVRLYIQSIKGDVHVLKAGITLAAWTKGINSSSRPYPPPKKSSWYVMNVSAVLTTAGSQSLFNMSVLMHCLSD